jgi:hypothetical protein
VPLPELPVAPDVMVIHASGVVAVHAQPLAVVTAMVEPAPPAAAIDCDEGLIAYVQGPG